MPTPNICQKSPVILKLAPGTYFWCSCGNSKSQPFCDGSHKGSEFSPVKFDITELRTVAVCMCKHTKGSPFCDGSHQGL